MFVYKHIETIKYIKKQANFKEIQNLGVNNSGMLGIKEEKL